MGKKKDKKRPEPVKPAPKPKPAPPKPVPAPVKPKPVLPKEPDVGVLIQSTIGWKNAKIGAGGLITGIDLAADGTAVCRADVFGAYLFDRTAPSQGNAGGLGRWQQLITTTSFANYLSLIQIPIQGSNGAVEIRIAPSDTNIFYMIYLGYVWQSANRGALWTQTAFTRDVIFDGNAQPSSHFQYKMAIDPINANVVYLVTDNNGGFKTLDGGASWSAISGLPANLSPYIGAVVIDPSSSNSSTPTRKSVIFISVAGKGLYKSTDGGGSFSSVTGGPGTSSTLSNMRISSNGTVYAIEYGANKLWRLVGSTWTNITPASALDVSHITPHPTDAENLILWEYNFGGFETTSATTGVAGSMWGARNNTSTITAADTPMFGTLYEPFFGNMQGPVWDPFDTTKIWTAVNQGICRITYPLAVSPSRVAMNSISAGLEEIVAAETVAPTGYSPLMLGWDVGVVRQTDLSKYALAQVYNTTQFLSRATAGAYAPDNPAFVVVSCDAQGGKGAYSLDGGATWTPFATATPSGLGGAIACAGNEIILVSGNDGRPYWSNDLGTTWSLITGLPNNNRWNGNIAYQRFNVTADQVNIGTFYITSTNGYGQTGSGIYKISNNAGTVVFTANVLDGGANCRLRAVPLNAGHLFFTTGLVGSGYGGGQAGNAASFWPAGSLFYRSVDAGVTFADVGALSSNNWTIRDVWSFGLGKPKPGGGGYPVIYLYGHVIAGSSPPPSGSQPSFWKSEDAGVTWIEFGSQFPNGWPDKVNDVGADMNIYNRVYVGYQGSGWQYYG